VIEAQSRSLLETLAAERAIYETYLRFFRLVDTGQFARVGDECFTRDALIEYSIMPGPVQRFEGRDAFTDFLSAGTADPGQMVAHVAGQHLIEWDGDRPFLTGYATIWHWFRSSAWLGETRPADWTTVGLVEDEYECVDGRWLISRRTVSRVAGMVAVGLPPLLVGFRRG
jgi:hypothetical protein